MQCWYCGEEIVWDGDFNLDDVFGEGEGIVTFLHCSACEAKCQFMIVEEDEI